MEKTRLADWLEQNVLPLYSSVEEWAREMKTERSTLYDALRRNRWSPELRSLLRKYMKSNPKVMAFKNFRLKDFEIIEVRDHIVTSKKACDLIGGLRSLAKAKLKDRESALISLFDSVTERCNAFLAVVTYGRMPSPFLDTAEVGSLREAIFGAHLRGMTSLYVMPNSRLIRRLNETYGSSTVPSLHAYQAGFDQFRRGFIDHCGSKGIGASEAETLADRRFGKVHYGIFDVASSQYISSYVGSARVQGFSAAIIERGPINLNQATVHPIHSGTEMLMRKYLERVFLKKATEINPHLHDEMVQRIKIRR